MRFASWFRPTPIETVAHRLYVRLVEQARALAFYADYGIPDTLDGRFEMVVLHVFVALRRLKRDGAPTSALAQAVFDAMFADMDRSLREIGVGDLSVGKRVKDMARGFYGRIAAYEAGLEATGGALAEALARNVYGTVPPPARPTLEALASYVRQACAAFDTAPAAWFDGADPLPWPTSPHPAETA